MNRRFFSALSGVLVVSLLAPPAARACAVCLTGGNDAVADAFNWSVLFLMATPYAVVGSIVGWLAFTYRRASAQRESIEPGKPPVQLAWNQKEIGR